MIDTHIKEQVHFISENNAEVRAVALESDAQAVRNCEDCGSLNSLFDSNTRQTRVRSVVAAAQSTLPGWQHM
jgi:hypothetical protein